MHHQAYPPSASLNHLVRCHWTFTSSHAELAQTLTVVPDGCVNMVFHCGAPYRQYMGGGAYVHQPRCFIIGQLTQPLHLQPTGDTDIFAVRFHPHGFSAFCAVSPRTMHNRAIPLEDLFGNAARILSDSVLGAGSAAERMLLIEHFLVQHLRPVRSEDESLVPLLDAMQASRGQIALDAVLTGSGLSRRQQERRFAQQVGLSPKQLCKMIRLQSVLPALLSGSFDSLTELAMFGDYYDQAHFIKDFRALTSFTPSQFCASRIQMSLFYCSPWAD